MKKFFHKILQLIKFFFILLGYILIFPVAIILYGKKTYVVSERKDEARDNGISFYKYMLNKHPECDCYYVIDKKCSDYTYISSLPNIVDAGSFKHFALFVGAKYKVTTTLYEVLPHPLLANFLKIFHGYGKWIFLQHGVIKNNHPYLYKENTNFNLFICGTKPEHKYITDNFNYSPSSVVYAGLSRWDELFEVTPKKQILIFPTWRRNASNLTDEEFKKTSYYLAWSSLIENKGFNNYLKDNNIECFFAIHTLFSSKIHLFDSTSNIKIIKHDEGKIPDYIRDSACLITDFSSVFFDFGFMNRPVIYYQFDQDTFDNHYSKGYFDYYKDGFGPVCLNEADVISKIKDCVENNFVLNDEYAKRISEAYLLRDNHNNDRIFEEISKL